MADRLTYLEIPCSDPERAARFYEGVCGWRIERRAADDFRFGDEDAGLIGRWTRGDAGGAGTIPYFTVASVQDAVARAVELGGDIVKAPFREGDLLVARLRDPSRNVIGVWQFASKTP